MKVLGHVQVWYAANITQSLFVSIH